MEMVPDLKKIESSTFRLLFLSDGLIDIYLGLVLIPYIVWIISGSSGSIIIVFAICMGSGPLLMLMKKWVVEPRVGRIKPGPRRRRKTKLLVLATVICVLITIGLVVFTSLAGRVAGQMMAGLPQVFWVFSLATILAAVVVAWLIDWPRVILYGILTAVAIPVDAVYFLRSGSIPLTVVPMLVMVGTGIVLLIRFLKRYPMPEARELT